MPYLVLMKSNCNTNLKDCSAIILAGGNSSRMGYPKPWVKKENGKTFLLDIVTSFIDFGILEVIVVLNKSFVTNNWKEVLAEVERNSTIIENTKPEKGRLYSLSLGLKASTSNFIFIHNVDSPFVEKETLAQLSGRIEINGITIPSYQSKGGHPVIINNAVSTEIVNNYENYETLKEVFNHFPKKYIEVDSDSILKNINTPEQLTETNYELA